MSKYLFNVYFNLMINEKFFCSKGKAISPQRILHVGQFIETDYTADAYVEELERRGLQSDTVLLSGESQSSFV